MSLNLCPKVKRLSFTSHQPQVDARHIFLLARCKTHMRSQSGPRCGACGWRLCSSHSRRLWASSRAWDRTSPCPRRSPSLAPGVSWSLCIASQMSRLGSSQAIGCGSLAKIRLLWKGSRCSRSLPTSPPPWRLGRPSPWGAPRRLIQNPMTSSWQWRC